MSFVVPMVGGHMASTKSVNLPDPNTRDERDMVSMSPRMFKSTFDEEYRKAHPATAALHAYRHRNQDETSMGYRLGEEYLRPALGRARGVVENILNTGALGAGTAAGLGAAGLGLLGAWGWNRMSDRQVSPMLAAILSGSLGAVLGGYGGHIRDRVNSGRGLPVRPYTTPRKYSQEDYMTEVNRLMGKSAAWRSPESSRSMLDARDRIMAHLRNAPGMSFQEKASLMDGVGRLSAGDAEALLRMLGMGGGAAVGATVARFLMGKGLVSTLLGAVAGGVIGSTLFGRRPPQPTTLGGQPIGRFY